MERMVRATTKYATVSMISVPTSPACTRRHPATVKARGGGIERGVWLRIACQSEKEVGEEVRQGMGRQVTRGRGNTNLSKDEPEAEKEDDTEDREDTGNKDAKEG